MKTKTTWITLLCLGLGIFNLTFAADHEQYLQPYQLLLSKHVSIGNKNGITTNLVDYINWGKDQSHHQQALSNLQKVDPGKLNQNAKKAFWINAYNLLTIDLIIKTNEKESIRNQGSVFKNVWKSHKWEIGGKSVTLDEIEHKILRPLADPRIHMAINCASLSCPDLRKEPYIVDKLDAQLEDQVKKFIANQDKGVTWRDSQLYISAIFKWFKSDFNGANGVLKFISKYTPQPIKNFNNNYLDYSWKLNSN